ncbi:hypothetical protein MVES1_002581 [Malassezia vespertilionis]|uniref:uncharacterized protein n=1 Tax=Malassezia vespertilionis TaxID=2020962 RepID=UPI0024B16686|nr:uncharacterized protein MVES1_002581 [Malassezia vespertilionis]WFD07222.1 hypothetical protein MVES1_002581 [Malassezia vespertilionis]
MTTNSTTSEPQNIPKAANPLVLKAFGEDEEENSAQPRPTRCGAMSSFLRELQEEQTIRDSQMSEPKATSTTNLRVQGLPSSCTEVDLGHYFAQWGNVASVKVRTLTQLTEIPLLASAHGFVAYMLRNDAEGAMRAADGAQWEGHTLTVTWSRALALPATPRFCKTAMAVHTYNERKRQALEMEDNVAFDDEVRA